LTGYSCARAFLAWILIVFALFFTLRHYGLIPELASRDLSSGTYVAQYLYDVAGRTLKDPFCLPMALILFGTLGYAVWLAAIMRALTRRLASTEELRSSWVNRWVNRVVGLPGLSKDVLSLFVTRGAAYATAPLRDAATLFPAVGFLGTVVGITIALGGLQQVMDKRDSGQLMSGLLTAFDTTFIGLLAAFVLTIVIFSIDAAIAQLAALLDDTPGRDKREQV
jgi:hypothetical protein